jgi:hypothetical protein
MLPPVAALFVAFFWIAVPAILLMAVWAGVTAYQLLFHDDALSPQPGGRPRRWTGQGESVPVRLRDIVEDERARRSVAEAASGDGPAGPPAHPLFDDLWLRRN